MRWALPLVVLGAALRFWFAATAGELRDDERRFLEIRRSLREGEGFSIAGRPTAQTMPLWPGRAAANARMRACGRSLGSKASVRLGRSKPRRKTVGSSSNRRATMSALVAASAVAVKAAICTPPRAARSLPMRR